MRTFVTGATGFVGSHVARLLVERGAEVRCLARASSPRTALDGVPVEWVDGDLRDGESVLRAIAGCSVVYHCAADYRLHVPDPGAMYATNVEGTRHVMAASHEHGVERVVYTSTVGALGLRHDGTPADETTPVAIEDMVGHYKRSKFMAERVAEEWAQGGLPVVIVNPSAPVGEGDLKPTATGQMIVDFLHGRMKAYVDTGLNLVDVRDVAAAHILAAERGRIGEKYILGNRNMTLKEICDALSAITGLPSARVRLPHWVPFVASAVDTALSRLSGRTPRLAMDAVRLSRHRMFFDGGKAVRELGMPQTPIERALERAVEWFTERGYARSGAAA